jgi:hypothetical protein
MPKSGGRMRIIEQSRMAIDLSRSGGGDTALRIGDREHRIHEATIVLSPGEARALAYSLLAAAERTEIRGERPGDGAGWPEEYYEKGTFPGDDDGLVPT